MISSEGNLSVGAAGGLWGGSGGAWFLIGKGLCGLEKGWGG